MPQVVEEGHHLRLLPNEGWDERIHIAECGDLVRSYLVRSRRFVLVYDTLLGPQSGAWLREKALEIAKGLPLLVFNSHADWDHYFGNQVFPEPILASRECRHRILEVTGPKELEQKREEAPESYGAVELVAPAVALDGEPLLDGGDLTFQVLKTLGHRPDHLGIFIPELKTLLPGDCAEDPIPLVDEDSLPTDHTVIQLIQSLTRMRDLEPEWVLANHAPPNRGTELLESNLRYLVNACEQARACGSLEELRERCPEPEGCEGFYAEAHQRTLKFAWEQRMTYD